MNNFDRLSNNNTKPMLTGFIIIGGYKYPLADPETLEREAKKREIQATADHLFYDYFLQAGVGGGVGGYGPP